MIDYDIPDDHDEGYDETPTVTCNRCRMEDLWWQPVGDKPVLFEHRPNGSIARHVCRQQAPVDVFDDIT